MDLGFTRADLPDDFLWGAATSAYQIEGHRFGAAGPTHWDSFAATPGNVVRAENGAVACDHYHRWEEDLDIIAAGNFDTYRFSTSWARVLPEGTGQPNEEGLDFYERLVDGMLERGIKPMATLYHWELPSALADKGGWRSADMPKWFADYTETVMKRIGDRVWSVATINEPWCVAWLSHFLGVHAPGLRDVRAAARATHHVLASHASSMRVMRDMGIENLGIAPNFTYAQPVDASEENTAAAARFDAIYNRLFLGPLFGRGYPDLALEGIEAHLPKGWHDDMADIAAPLDWVGINYYTREVVTGNPGAWPSVNSVPGSLPKTAMGWEIYPDGLHSMLHLVQEHARGLPIYVTENGLAAPDLDKDGEVRDPERIDYLGRHVAAARRAMSEGVNLKGYYVWSLLDNYEWALGYEKRFGIVHVDFDTLKRTPKASYHALQKALAR